MNDLEKVSVIMGLYNCAGTLPQAIESILNQTYDNWELIMCDDGSSDNTYAVALEFRDKYPEKIILIRNERNSYLAATLNHCLRYATGTYVARMDADDISLPERFERQVDFLRKNSEYQLVGTAMQLFDDSGDLSVLSRPEQPDKYSLRNGTVFSHPTIMTYKYVYDELGGYTVSRRTIRGQDYDLWFRFYARGFKGYNLSDVLYRFKEDLGAVRRRTIKTRIDNYKTILIGFKLLNYPLCWYIKPTFLLAKCMVPPYLQFLYHRCKGRKR